MRLKELTDEEKVILSIKNIRYDFSEDEIFINDVISIIQGSAQRKRMAKATIDNILNEIKIFLNQKFPNNDPNVIAAKNIYKKILNMKKGI